MSHLHTNPIYLSQMLLEQNKYQGAFIIYPLLRPATLKSQTLYSVTPSANFQAPKKDFIHSKLFHIWQPSLSSPVTSVSSNQHFFTQSTCMFLPQCTIHLHSSWAKTIISFSRHITCSSTPATSHPKQLASEVADPSHHLLNALLMVFLPFFQVILQ